MNRICYHVILCGLLKKADAEIATLKADGTA